MAASPRVLLSIDYESWLTLAPRYDKIIDSSRRRELDGGFTLQALDPILEKLGDAKASFYLVGEIAGWYPEIPNKIQGAGHELGLHCQTHRSLVNVSELAADIQASASWRKDYRVRGYRSPMVAISEAAYPLLEQAGFFYSSSIYAPTGTLFQRGGIWELPVSSYKLFGRKRTIMAPRDFSMKLVLSGEFPYGSSFSIGVASGLILKILETELRAGQSPVIILHPYELVRPSNWPARLGWDYLRNPLMWPFSWSKASFLSDLLRHFPVSPLGSYLDEVVATHAIYDLSDSRPK
jgi:Polysaccharide deacetylase